MARLDSHDQLCSHGQCNTQLHPIDSSDHRNHKEKVLRFTLKFKTAVASAVAAGALMAVGASSASAVPAAFNIPANTTASAKVTGTIAINGGPLTCTYTNANAAIQNSGSPSQGRLFILHSSGAQAPCTNGNTMSASFSLVASRNGTAFSLNNTGSLGLTGKSPFSPTDWWAAGTFTLPWTNGAGATPSSTAFSSTQVAHPSSPVLFWTGTLQVRKSDGSLATLS